MKKIANIFILSAFVLVLFPLRSSAVIIAPPPSCDAYSSFNTTVGNTFHLQNPLPDYVNGLLVIHLTFNSSLDDRDFNLRGTLLRSENCDYLDSINGLPVHVPEGVSNISLRFTFDSSFQIFDDSTGNPLICDNCQVALIPGDVPPYKFQFFLNTDFNNNYADSQPFEVRDPIYQPPKTPVLLIPGSLATDINKGSEKLWLDVQRLIITPDDRFMDPLGFNDNGTPIDTSLTLGGVLKEVVEKKFDYSQALLNEFASQNYFENQQLYLFSYDWRKDIAENALGPLKEKIDALTKPGTSGKVDVIAHSQGGLLIKRLLYEKPEYENKINKLIFVGTPHLGAPKSFKVLREGDQFGIKYLKILGLDPEEIVRISHNMPAVYEMLPTAEYFHHYDGYWGQLNRHLFRPNEEVLYDYQTTKQKLKDAGYNSSLIDNSDVFHAFAYDQFDFSNSGIQVYNIVGCQTPTYGGVIEKSFAKDKIIWVSGDETVPLKSATNVVKVNTFYALNATHSTMLTEEGIRQKIVNLITGNTLPESGLTSNIGDCHFNGEAVSAHSPVDMHIYDNLGRHTGPTTDGGFDTEIPGLGYEIIKDEKFAFLPEGSQYRVKLVATGAGSFDFYSSPIDEGQTTGTAYYDHIPITPSSTAEIILNAANNQSIQLDTNGDGLNDATITPSSLLDANQSQDLLAPVSTSTLLGLMGAPGFYRSDVSISLAAEDPILEGQEDQTAGIFKTLFSIDSGEFIEYTGTTTIVSEGQHLLKFYSIDKAGNNEQPQAVNFTIDKQSPEFNAQFNPLAKDFDIFAADNLDPNPAKTCTANQCLATDQAGNTALLTFQKPSLPLNLKHLILKAIGYNNSLALSLDLNLLAVAYSLSGGKVADFHQTELIKGQQITKIAYSQKKNQSIITDLTKNAQPQTTTAAGIKILQISTAKGILKTSIK